jgi:choline kinase
MKAIIVAAGRGKRLGPETEAIPKCMVKVGGRSILHWQLDALAAAGVDDVVVVRGYRGDCIAPPSDGPAAGVRLRFVENPEWASNNILASLLFAETEMTASDFLFSYSDIVFSPDHARRVAAATASSVALVVDRRWREAYEGRLLHPVSEAELARVEGTGEGARVTRVGKRLVAADEAAGEFTGLARFSAAAGVALRDVWREAVTVGMDAPFGAAATLRQAYLSDGLNALSARGVALGAVLVDGHWREIDTEEDLARAERLVGLWS